LHGAAFGAVFCSIRDRMPLSEGDVFMLRTYPLGEADRIAAFFSPEHGKVRGVANVARRMKNRFGAALEPLAHSRIVSMEKENRDLVRIQSADLLDSPMGDRRKAGARMRIGIKVPLRQTGQRRSETPVTFSTRSR
jgi:hypothetical protein